LGPDPSGYVAQLQDCRLFESGNITLEDMGRTSLYRAETVRKAAEVNVTDMDTYLESLRMAAKISEFTVVDAPRLAQLINKSNQFNLTTRRRSEAEVLAIMRNPDFVAFSVRLSDRFGDHGLISIVIAELAGDVMKIDTWLMSCRVLKRQVEDLVLNEVVRLAQSHGCLRVDGEYLPTAKNEMVREFFPSMGFVLTDDSSERRKFSLSLDNFQPISTKITITDQAHESN
jgi:FkbH-like protein